MPEQNVLNIIVNNEGKVFMGMDNQNNMLTLIQDMNDEANLGLNAAEMKKFQTDPLWGIPFKSLKGYLDLPQEKMTEVITSKDAGVPLDSINGGKSEFQLWVTKAKAINSDMTIAIKADAATPYERIKKVMSELQDMSENRYYLITNLKTGSED